MFTGIAREKLFKEKTPEQGALPWEKKAKRWARSTTAVWRQPFGYVFRKRGEMGSRSVTRKGKKKMKK